MVPVAVAHVARRRRTVVSPDGEHQPFRRVVVETKPCCLAVLRVAAPVEYLAEGVAGGVWLEPEGDRVGVVRRLLLEFGETGVGIWALEILAAGDGEDLAANGVRHDFRDAVGGEKPRARADVVPHRVVLVVEEPADRRAGGVHARVGVIHGQSAANGQPAQIDAALVAVCERPAFGEHRAGQVVG